MIAVVLGFAGVVLLLAGPTMLMRGWAGRRTVARELTDQRISFPADDHLPSALSRYAGAPVRTGDQARAFAQFIGGNVAQATGGRTYAEIVDEYVAGGRRDERLAKLRETAFMGQSLRGALLGAYQASQVALLVMGLGAALTLIGAAFLALALQA